MECTPALDNMDEELGYVCLRWITIDEEEHSTVAEKELKNRTELNVNGWFGVEPLSAIRGVVYVVSSNYDVSSLSIALAWPYHCFYINRFY